MIAYDNKLLVVSPSVEECAGTTALLEKSHFFGSISLSPINTLANLLKILEFCHLNIPAILLTPSAFKNEEGVIWKIQECRPEMIIFTCENLFSETFVINRKFGNSLCLILPEFNKNIILKYLCLQTQGLRGQIQVELEKIHQ